MVTMTAQLTALLRDGVRLDFTDPERPEFQVLPQHRAQVTALLAPDLRAETQRTLRAIARYRTTLLRIFALIAQDADSAAEYQEQVRLHDDLGPQLAAFVSALAVEEYTTQTGRCGHCGNPAHRGHDR